MDKLKALEYFVAAVEEGSFARAAQRLEISTPAVQKLVGALERSLGLSLLERGARGVRLTASGSEYLDRSRALLSEVEELGHAERRLKGAGERPSGTLSVAAHSQLAHHVLLPALPRFHALYPDIEIDFRIVNRIGDADATSADVLLLHGWPEVPPDYVHRKLGDARGLIMAAPEHWAAHGVPQHPSELAGYTCLLMRNPAGIVLDLWEFKRDGQTVQVQAKGWLSSNAREATLDLVIGGHGVGRFAELTTREHVQSGRLVPVLLDWAVQGAPPVNLLFKGNARRTPRLRAFIDFATQCLRDMEAEGDAGSPRASTDRPAWHVRGYGRASATVRGRR
ncbi:HTH lysR-type domain-containing protein [Rubrivivax sp. A210]|uniref:LysR family transcriptional regulator n=1 Tax=Rubrivivax sp. A210 TaxID=2772301 RepID=UPI00191896EC|nr:LysR family transcriptional regulator [Rubrivivax sp. A210]CAD5372729.1 HTH lysR-type domain-containing protein [Rubrivivax sp. A210]